MNILKLILLCVLVGFLGFAGLKSCSSARKSDGFALINLTGKRSPLEKHTQELKKMTQNLFRPLTGKQMDETPRLKMIWEDIQSDVESEELAESNFKIFSEIIRQLNIINSERMMFEERLIRINEGDFPMILDEKASLEKKKTFSENVLLRSWNEWVETQESRLTPFFNSLPD